MNTPLGKTPMIAACGSDACDHVWIICWLPMEMMTAAKVMQNGRCPLCGNARVSVASSAQIEAAGMGL